MAFITSFISSFISIFIISHLVYVISGRNKKVAGIAYLVFLIISLFSFINYATSGLDLGGILFAFLITFGPLITAFLVFQRFTGAFMLSVNTRKLKHAVPKRAYDVFVTLKKDRLNALFTLMGSIIMLASFFLLEDIWSYLVILLGVIGIGLSISLYKKFSNIKEEYIILVVGKDMEKIYRVSVDQSKTSFKINDYFKNSDYIVDGIGTIFLKDHAEQIEKHHIFWLATNDKVPMENEAFEFYKSLPYKEQLKLFKKYEFRQVSFIMSKMGHIEVTKNQRIR